MKSRGTKLTAWTAIGVLLAVALGYFFALDLSPVHDQSSYRFDLAEIRQLAHSGTGNLPTRINGLGIASAKFPHVFVVAGKGWGGQPILMESFQVVFPDSSLVIDSALDKASIDEFFAGSPFFPDRYDAMQRAMTQATAILFTHEHPDHVGGVAKSPAFSAIANKTVLTQEQFDSLHNPELNFPQDRLSAVTPLNYDRIHLFAPGVVLLKAPGHSPGSQIIYVALQDGQEFLFVGDIGWSLENFLIPRGRPWAVSYFFLHEDRAAVAQQLRALHELAISPPETLHLVVAHDQAQFQAYVNRGWVHDGFQVQ